MNALQADIKATATSILLVDDDAIFRSQLGRAFTRRQYNVYEAEDLQSALELLTTIAIDLAVIDLKLKHESGLTILAELKKVSPATKSIVITGYGTVATAVKALKLGAVNYVTKPIDTEGIIAALAGDHSDSTQKNTGPSLEQVEWDYIQRVISEHAGNLTHAAKALGLHRRSLQRKLSKLPGRIV